MNNILNDEGVLEMYYIIQYCLLFIFLTFCGFISFYEGSDIFIYSESWKESAFFTQLLGKEITTPSDISQLDLFIYSLKYKPIFPICFIVLLIYLITLTIFLIFRRNRKKLNGSLILIGVFFIITAFFIGKPYSLGIKILLGILISCGILYLSSPFLLKRIKSRLSLN
ncbi:DUF4306 domain-containing protein [Radiobacillus kanasensis]|uniref:DUF4306 domain-containing protein n=1 Tax=Radiobacillus kanasensis TaxID=2844358 RepID=UPI0038B66782